MRDLGPVPINHGRLATPDAGCKPALPVRHSGECRSPGRLGGRIPTFAKLANHTMIPLHRSRAEWAGPTCEETPSPRPSPSRERVVPSGFSHSGS